MKVKLAILVLGFVFGVMGGVVGASELQAQEKSETLPELYEGIPQKMYEILGPVGVGKEDVAESRERLRYEAKKLDADAVIAVRCQTGGIRRQGLTWVKESAYCKGMAVRWRPTPSMEPSAGKHP